MPFVAWPSTTSSIVISGSSPPPSWSPSSPSSSSSDEQPIVTTTSQKRPPRKPCWRVEAPRLRPLEPPWDLDFPKGPYQVQPFKIDICEFAPKFFIQGFSVLFLLPSDFEQIFWSKFFFANKSFPSCQAAISLRVKWILESLVYIRSESKSNFPSHGFFYSPEGLKDWDKSKLDSLCLTRRPMLRAVILLLSHVTGTLFVFK